MRRNCRILLRDCPSDHSLVWEVPLMLRVSPPNMARIFKGTLSPVPKAT